MKKNIELYFDTELSDFFRVKSGISYPLDRRASIKDIIEAQGVPHTEVGEIFVDDRPVNFSFIASGGQKVIIKAVQAPFEIFKPSLLRPNSFKNMRFVVDVNVGKLAPLLRMMGYDTFFDNELRDKEIVLLAHEQKRVVLSRDRALLKHGLIEFGRLIRSQKSDEQLKEVTAFFGLNCEMIYTRCMRCNHLLREVKKEQIVHRLEPKTKKYFYRFSICHGCDRIYWPGSHWEKLNKLMKIARIC